MSNYIPERQIEKSFYPEILRRGIPSPTEAFHQYLAMKKAPKTRDGYAFDIQSFYDWNLPDDLEFFRDRSSCEAVQMWVNQLIMPVDEGGQGLAATSAKRKLSAIRHFFEYCVVKGLLDRNPAHKMLVSPPAAPPWEPNLGLTTAQVRAMAEVCRQDKDRIKGLRDLAILSIGFTCCLRVSEISGTSVHDIRRDREDVLLHILKAKGGFNQKVQMPTSTKQRIEDYILALGGFGVLRPDKGIKGEDRFPVFVSLSNRSKFHRLSESGICKIIERRGLEAGVLNINIHSHLLRHSGITHLFELGWDIRRIQMHARHKDPKTTQIYHDIWFQRKHSAAEALGDLFEGKKVSRPDFSL